MRSILKEGMHNAWCTGAIECLVRCRCKQSERADVTSILRLHLLYSGASGHRMGLFAQPDSPPGVAIAIARSRFRQPSQSGQQCLTSAGATQFLRCFKDFSYLVTGLCMKSLNTSAMCIPRDGVASCVQTFSSGPVMLWIRRCPFAGNLERYEQLVLIDIERCVMTKGMIIVFECIFDCCSCAGPTEILLQQKPWQ